MDGPLPWFVYWVAMKYAVRSLLLSVFAVAALSCDKATPTAPSGSILSISANPRQITVNGASTISIVGRRSNGSPLAEGTEIRLSANIGTIDSLVTLDRNGEASAILRGDGRVGVATVTATTGTLSGGGSGGSGGSGGAGGAGGSGGSGGSSGGGGSTTGLLTASIDVEVGSSARTITLQATPTNIPIGETTRVNLFSLVRDARGLPLAGANVNFLTEFGTLASGGRLVQTNAQGEARDTLTVRRDDLESEPASITVTAQTAGSDGALVSATFDIQVRTDRLEVSFTFDPGESEFDVDFDSAVSGGSGSFDFSWDFGDGSSSSAQDPSHTYSPGNYRVTLTVTDRQTQLSDTARANIVIPLDEGGSSE
jgi:PKD domain